MRIFAIILVIIGFVIRYVVKRNRFNRRRVGGLQHFSSYEEKTAKQFAEGMGMLIAILLIVGGIIIFVRNTHI